ncbi:MAG TPA: M56 family metallopeptidase [Trebonia sp.]|nr:M56 family metallopeptidase [Trebonia sp.]
MIAALALGGYTIVVACCAPALLVPLTRGGASVRPGLAAWLSAMASAVVAAAIAVALITQAAVTAWPTLTRVVCQQVAGTTCTPQVYRSALYSAGVAILAAVIILAALAALWRYGRRTRRTVTRTRLHARAVLLAGRELAGTGAVVLDDPRPVAYCVAGRPAAIVVTSGALALLDSRQLAAVLAHERAHLAGRHHLLVTVTRGLAAALPGVPLFTRGAEEVARLAELAADDTAARSVGRSALVAALLAIATGSVTGGTAASTAGSTAGGTAGPGARPALAAASLAVPARVERLLDPPARRTAAMAGLALALVSAVLIALPAALAAVAGAAG